MGPVVADPRTATGVAVPGIETVRPVVVLMTGYRGGGLRGGRWWR